MLTGILESMEIDIHIRMKLTIRSVVDSSRMNEKADWKMKPAVEDTLVARESRKAEAGLVMHVGHRTENPTAGAGRALREVFDDRKARRKRAITRPEAAAIATEAVVR